MEKEENRAFLFVRSSSARSGERERRGEEGGGGNWAMAILFALVARGSVVLAEFAGAALANASSISRQVLERIPSGEDSHVSYSQDRYIFHVKRTDGITVLCVADDAAGRELRSNLPTYLSLSAIEILMHKNVILCSLMVNEVLNILPSKNRDWISTSSLCDSARFPS